jgi:proteasome lid subunit RPN8/RPN11
MRWTDAPVDLPLQPMSALQQRMPQAGEVLTEGPGLQVVVPDSVRATVMAHLRASGDEQGGLLVGEVFASAPPTIENCRVVVVRQAIAALDFSSSGISLRMESGVWERARLSLGPDELVVGWYHSHPGLGAFFSETDRRTQAAFFPHLYSLGWVVDPLRGEEAFFVGRDCANPGALLRIDDREACDRAPAPT